MKVILFIAHIGLNKNTEPNGVSIKNRHILNYLKQKNSIKVKVIDTEGWRSQIITLFFKLVYYPFFCDSVILSTNTSSAEKIIKYLSFFRLDRKTIYVTVGGSFSDRIKTGVHNINSYKNLKRIFVQTYKMEATLLEEGLSNVKRMPNSKFFDNLFISEYNKPSLPIKCYYLGRIHPDKGINMIFDALSVMNQHAQTYQVDFFGPIDKKYENIFFELISKHSFANYKGVIDLTENKMGYEQLAEYDLFLFPTYWQGEGFPGVVLDSFISGVPVLASNWNHNSEVVQDGFNGILFEAKNLEDFKLKLTAIADNPGMLAEMKKNAHTSSQDYKSEYVLKALDELF